MRNHLFILTLITITLQTATTAAQQAQHHWATSPYFNTKFLSQYDLVEQILIRQSGFKPVTFKASDGVKLSGLFLKQPNAVGTLIFCAGFFPGRKEGQAPIFRMLPPRYNILFFDARGHAKSEGPFFSTLSQYGKHEYKDVLGAISFVNKNIGGKIVVYGVCAGAFHAAHALIKLSQENKLDELGISGLVFDSGYASFLQTTQAGKYHLREKLLPGMLHWYADKKKIKDTYFYKLSAFCLTNLGLTLKKFLVTPGLKKLEPETNLLDKMHAIGCPVFFIHSHDDNYAPFENAQQLAETVQNKTCWWIEHSSHALHALKHKHEYRKRLLSFLGEQLG